MLKTDKCPIKNMPEETIFIFLGSSLNLSKSSTMIDTGLCSAEFTECSHLLIEISANGGHVLTAKESSFN